MPREYILRFFLLCATFVWSARHGTQSEFDQPTVTTRNGVVQGVATSLGRYFRGIPYAAPPVGDLRLRSPQPPLNWSGILNASTFGANCHQVHRVVNDTARCSAWPTIQGCNNISEDCLFLNVATPNLTQSDPAMQKWPVIVYIHAGEFYVGSGNDLENNWPYSLHDVAVVTFNFRMGNMGFLAAEELRHRNSDNSTGNYGIQDQRAVLQWVQNNIAGFGGDPNNVILMGESSGGTSVAAHLAMKKSWGLFHKVIMESPGLTQVKRLEDNVIDTKYRLAQLALAGTPNCSMLPYGGDYDTPGAWMEIPNCPMNGPMLFTANFTSVRDAVNACNENATCVGLTYINTTDALTNITVIQASFSSVYSAVLPVDANVSSTFLRAPDTSSLEACFINLPATDFYDAFEAPHEDTDFKDLYAPTIDGIEMSSSIIDIVLHGELPPGVQYLMGSNLDEGTEFIGLSALTSCNMSFDDLATWAFITFSNDRVDWSPSVTQKIVQGIASTYLGDPSNASDTRLELPVPSCDGTSFPNKSAYIAATRAIGDACFYCWVKAFADRLTLDSPLQQNGSSVFHYYFTHTPTVSLNMQNLEMYGAFHGSEVPFVFGFPPELGTDAERFLSNAMGCYWSNFAHSGDPNNGPCNNTEHAPVTWPVYRPIGSINATPFSTLILDTGNQTGNPSSSPIHVGENHRMDKCALFAD